MEALWTAGPLAIREIQEHFPQKGRPAYTTVQTMVHRLEVKKALRRARKIGNAHIFAPAIPRKSAVGLLVDQLVNHLGGSAVPVVSHLVESGQLSLKEIKEIEALLSKRGK